MFYVNKGAYDLYGKLGTKWWTCLLGMHDLSLADDENTKQNAKNKE